MYRYKRIRLKNGTTKDEHRLIMERKIGRKLTFNEVVHHKNGNGRDNRLENLEIVTRSEHTRHHHNSGELHKLGKEDYLLGQAKLKLVSMKKRINPINEKYHCSYCHAFKNKNMFHKNKSKWHGLSSVCKPCKKEYSKKYYIILKANGPGSEEAVLKTVAPNGVLSATLNVGVCIK